MPSHPSSTRSPLLAALLGGAAVCASLHSARARAADEWGPFDAPRSQTHLALTAVPAGDDLRDHPQVSCYYYDGVMVKETQSAPGDDVNRLAIVSWEDGRPEPHCRLDAVPGEVPVTGWEGSFLGVRDQYLFFASATHDGFAVFAASGEKIFDSGLATLPLREVKLLSPKGESPADRSAHATPPLLLRYSSTYVAPCSMAVDKKNCKNLTDRVIGLPALPCARSQSTLARDNDFDDYDYRFADHDQHVVEYIVEVVIDQNRVVRMNPLAEKAVCMP